MEKLNMFELDVYVIAEKVNEIIDCMPINRIIVNTLEKENSNVAEPNRYTVLADVIAEIEESTFPYVKGRKRIEDWLISILLKLSKYFS